MSSEADKKDAVDELYEQLKNDGVAVRSVTDGHILMFKRVSLQEILDKYPDSKEIAIFVKRPDVN